jgi:uncharacterized zinc-type alcohol dehydrogenase-like protein
MDFSKPTESKCYLVPAGNEPLIPGTIPRRALGANDVAIKIKYAGICHSDIHQAREEWGKGTFPMVPGHEIAGFIEAVGRNVSDFVVGEKVGVGCMVDSCRTCANCRQGEEQYCGTGAVFTYNGRAKYPHCEEYTPEGGAVTQGGYSQHIIVDKNFVLHVPDNLAFEAVAPLLCAGITTYSPLIHYGLQPHMKFGVAGLGGLGHMAAKFGVAFGAHTTVISRGQSKKESALNELKVHAYLDSADPAAMKAAAGSYDFIVSTISAPHDMTMYINLLKTNGKLILVGVPPGQVPLSMNGLIFGRRTIAGSLIGGIRETQEMLDFCGRNNIVCDVEMIRAEQVNEAYDRTMKSDVKYRFVIDVDTI